MAVSDRVLKSMENSSWIRKMFETGGRLKAEFGEDNVFDFSLGNPNIEPPKEFTAALIEYVNKDIKGKHSYMPNAGYPDVREKVAAYINETEKVSVNTDCVVMTCGAAGAINAVLKTILNPGDNVITSTPYFAEYRAYVDNYSGVLVEVPSTKDFDLDVNAIEKAVNSKTAAVIVNSPNNPSGRVFPETTIRALSEMLERKGKETGRAVYLLSDEPYKKIVYNGVKVPSVLANYKNTIVLTSYSKDLSIPGERIGWLAVHPEADDFRNLIDGIIMCNRILGFVNAPAIMQKVIASLQGRSVDIDFYRKKRDRLCVILKEAGFSFVKPEGTFYLFPEAPGGDDIKAVAALQEERILTVPGSGFGTPGYFRISYCVADKVIEGSAEGFRRAFKLLTGGSF